MKSWQFVNHFPGTFAISNKVALARNIERIQRLLPDVFNFHPKSFLLPAQISHLRSALTKGPKPLTYIVKPDLGAQGRGIFLVQDPDSVSNFKEAAVAQEYIEPYLIGGTKFDLRIYVLMASVDPLRLYIFKEGMARFCTEPYSTPTADNIGEVFRHLTNYSLNKHNVRFKKNDEIDGTDSESHKRSMSSVFRDIERAGGDVTALRAEIDRILVLTIISALPFLQHNYHTSFKIVDQRSRCFEILGFDVLLDANLKPWVVEVNHSPSLSCDSLFDIDLKERVIAGALKIIDIPHDIVECMQHNERLKTVERIGGAPLQCCQWGHKYSVEREVRMARITDWRPLFPLDVESPLSQLFDEAIVTIRGLPMDGMDDTQLTSKRRQTITEQVKQARDVPPPRRPCKYVLPAAPSSLGSNRDPLKLTRSAFLLREARLAKISEEAKRESPFLFSERLESYLRTEKSGIQTQLQRGKSDSEQIRMSQRSME
jgi:tubulin polyglutamylase TTLL6/13